MGLDRDSAEIVVVIGRKGGLEKGGGVQFWSNGRSRIKRRRGRARRRRRREMRKRRA